MNDVKLTQELKEFLLMRGADLVGVGPVERWENAPPDAKPNVYMADAKCVVAIASHIPNAACDVWGTYEDPPGKTAGPYMYYGHKVQDLELMRLANLGAKWLERKGYEGLVFPDTFYPSTYRKAEWFDGDFSHRHAAVACGLGEIGYNGILLTPEFGARQRVNSIITDAPLVGDPMYDGPPICPVDECERRFGKPCIKNCPPDALGDKYARKVEIQIGGKTYKYQQVNKLLCEWGTAFMKAGGTRSDLKPPMSWDEWAELSWKDFNKGMEIHSATFGKLSNIDNMMYKGFGLAAFCGRCSHQCAAITFIRERQQKSKK